MHTAKKSREKRIAYVNSKQRDEMDLEEKNSTLWDEHENLRNEIDLLKEKINIILRNCENCRNRISTQNIGSHIKTIKHSETPKVKLVNKYTTVPCSAKNSDTGH